MKRDNKCNIDWNRGKVSTTKENLNTITFIALSYGEGSFTAQNIVGAVRGGYMNSAQLYNTQPAGNSHTLKRSFM